MKADTRATVSDAPPPKVVLRVANPLVRFLLRTPVGRVIRPLAVIEFRGRRSGQVRRIVVGWHIVAGSPVVVTPAGWRANFADSRSAVVRWRGRNADYVGTLETDPDIVADAINTMLGTGASARSLALRIPTGHTVDAADVVRTHRALVRFEATSFSP
jgi:hypothetical protein